MEKEAQASFMQKHRFVAPFDTSLSISTLCLPSLQQALHSIKPVSTA
jgi:hypothetical protein